MHAVDVAVVSAAGFGSRLGRDVPKALVPVAGRPIIDHQLDLLRDVPDVRIVVGFREEEVVRHVRALRPDAVFVRNPDFATTSTLQSVHRAVRHLHGPFLAIDGDLIIEPSSFRRFVERCSLGAPLVGVTAASSDDAVFIVGQHLSDGTVRVERFQRHPITELEWTGMAFLDHRHVRDENTFMFQALSPSLPLRGQMVRSVEVDTPGDLARADAVLTSGWWGPVLEASPR